MDIKVDSHISAAIDRMAEDQGITFVILAEKMGVSCASITKWRRVGSGITSQKWKRLFPMIKQYLPEDRIYIDDSGRQYSSTVQRTSSYFFEPKFVPQSVFLFTLQQLNRLNLKIETATQLGEKLKLESAEYRPKHKNASDVVALTIPDNSLAPVLPKGTMLFVCANLVPKNKCIALAKERGDDKSSFVGVFVRDAKNKTVSLMDVNNSEKILAQASEKTVDQVFAWILPVLYYEVTAYK